MPLRQVVKSHRHFAGDTLHSHIGTQPPQHLDHQREILLGGTQAEAAGLGVVLGGKGRSPNELQLVELDRFERQGIDSLHLPKKHSVVFAGQPQNEMGPDVQPPCALAAIACRAAAKSWPRRTARNVSSQVDSTPYSTAT